MSGKFFVSPSVGLFLGLANADKNKEGGKGGLILGNFVAQLGLLGGANVGFGHKWGLFSGLVGAVALLPLLGFGFVGIPLGVHFRRKWGLGIVIPVWMVPWWAGLLVGLICFGLAVAFGRK